MPAFKNAISFFHACEDLQGWEGCKQFVADNAVFSGQCEPLADIALVKDYCEWMAGLGKGPLVGCSYSLHSSAWDAGSQTALFFATFRGQHTGDGGPVPATGKSTQTHYVYAITMDENNKVCAMTKIWNAPWALSELGWT
ncbi:MAG: hypothetical protein ABJ084_07060 [Halioglobus sp.]